MVRKRKSGSSARRVRGLGHDALGRKLVHRLPPDGRLAMPLATGRSRPGDEHVAYVERERGEERVPCVAAERAHLLVGEPAPATSPAREGVGRSSEDCQEHETPRSIHGDLLRDQPTQGRLGASGSRVQLPFCTRTDRHSLG